MADDNPAPKPPLDLEPDAAVLKRLDDDSEVRHSVSFVGFIGPSKVADNIRLYSDLSLTSYLEIPKAAIHDRLRKDPNDPNSPSILAVDPHAKIEQRTVTVRSVEAGALAGSISQARMAAAVAHQKTLAGTGGDEQQILGFTDTCISCRPCFTDTCASCAPCTTVLSACPDACTNTCPSKCNATCNPYSCGGPSICRCPSGNPGCTPLALAQQQAAPQGAWPPTVQCPTAPPWCWPPPTNPPWCGATANCPTWTGGCSPGGGGA